MTATIDRRRFLRLGLGASVLAGLGACDTTSFNFGPLGDTGRPRTGAQTFGDGPTRVALLLPLSGDPALSNVGISMGNAAQLAMDYVGHNPRIGDNITLSLRDTGSSAQGAAQQAQAAVNDGAALILGPLRADQVASAGAIAKAAGIPLIGFSNNAAVAAPGIYLLNVLPDTEVHRSLIYAVDRGRPGIAGVFRNDAFGMAQQAAFQQALADLKLTSGGIYSLASDAQVASVAAQLAAQIVSGAVDAVFMPDRASAPALAGALVGAGARQGKVLLIGSADWDNDPAIVATPYLAGAVYPAVDDTGYRALQPEYAARFGGNPHPLATIAYTATILANAPTLANGHYSEGLLTLPGGFNGRDGVFRFLPNGRSQYALIMKQVTAQGAVRIDGPKL